jgi:hypothetical protein
LFNVAGLIYAKEENPKTKIVKYSVDIQLHFINRVYLARSIEQKGSRGTKSSAGTQYGNNPPPANNGPLTGNNASQGPAVGSVGAQSITASNVVQGQANKDYSDESSLILHLPPFQRPVVFGYRAVKREFKYNLDSDKSQSAEEDGK